MKVRIIVVLCLLAGCSDLPDIGPRVSDAALAAPYPRLVPLDGILAQADRLTAQSETIAIDPGRLARLRDRANRLRGPIIEPATRARMLGGINRTR